MVSVSSDFQQKSRLKRYGYTTVGDGISIQDVIIDCVLSTFLTSVSAGTYIKYQPWCWRKFQGQTGRRSCTRHANCGDKYRECDRSHQSLLIFVPHLPLNVSFTAGSKRHAPRHGYPLTCTVDTVVQVSMHACSNYHRLYPPRAVIITFVQVTVVYFIYTLSICVLKGVGKYRSTWSMAPS